MPVVRGSEHNRTSLTEADVVCMRAEYAATEGLPLHHADKVTYKDLASRYGVGVATVGFIIARKTWKHVQ